LSRDNKDEPLVVISGLRKRFAEREVLQGIDLAVKAGEVVCIMGPSGTGKSTILRCINALEPFEAGEVSFDGAPFPRTGRAAIMARRRIGMIFQNFNLYPHLTALENVMLAPCKVLGQERSKAQKHALDLFGKVRVGHRAHAYPGQMSGGEQQRVAIARALAMDPSLLLFDEPTSALDPETVGDVLAVMEDLARERRTMIVVTHETGFARHVADRIVFMDDGRIAEEGDPAEIIGSPKLDRTKKFFGSILHG